MAWIYLAESAESAWPYLTGSGRSPIVRETHTLPVYFFREWQQEICLPRRSGTTCKLSLEKCCRQLTSFTADSPVRTSALRALARAWMVSEVDFSSKSSGLFSKLMRRLFFSKTFRPLELAVLEKSSEHLPIFGMTVDGLVYQPKSLEPRTSEKDGFSLLPTPTACDYGKNNGRNSVKARDRYSLTTIARHNLWPTPTVCGNNQNKVQGNSHLIGLATAVGGKLNPAWVEWLMGYHGEWTALEDWAMQWFQLKRKKRSKDFRESPHRRIK